MLRYTHNYSSVYNPSMPMVEIQLFRSASQQPIFIEAIVDTGSDATMIPLRYLR